MRTIGVDEINDIALGASLLGAGGGGDPYIGRLMAMQAVKECGPVTLIEPDEVPDDAFIAPCAMMGAPTVMTEKGGGKDDFDRLFDLVEQYSGKKIYATMPMEAGGVNSMLPIAAAARRGIPLVDADVADAIKELTIDNFSKGEYIWKHIQADLFRRVARSRNRRRNRRMPCRYRTRYGIYPK